MPAPIEILKRLLTRATHRIFTLPVVVLMPHSRCNCRCVMCDIWRANQNRQELSREDLTRHVDAFRKFNVQWAVLSGGEALMHTHLWTLCELLKGLGVRITLLSTGLLLKPHAPHVARWVDEVIVSLDGSRETHDAIRGVPQAYDRLAEGVAALRAVSPRFRVTARCVLQRRNFRDLPRIIAAAHDLKLDQISFLAADTFSTAFNRPEPWDAGRVADIALPPEEVDEFREILEETLRRCASDFASGFIAEAPDKLRRLPRYYAALNGDDPFPQNACNAPHVSAVVEADGTVRPCFFHRPLGNIHEQPLDAILNAPESIAFRRRLSVRNDPICRRCVCTLRLGLRTEV
ncbi:radical SAM protein [bacterium]|nr:radical SAM protein [bacterium]